MLNLTDTLIDSFLESLATSYRTTYGESEPLWGDAAVWAGRLALGQVANTNALYHNVEHTIMVTSAGLALIQGKHMVDGEVEREEWLHFVLALLFHDIGYVRYICRADNGATVATGVGDETVDLPDGASDAVLEPYHVDRAKLFVQERFGEKRLPQQISWHCVADQIEATRVHTQQPLTDFSSLAQLVRAADIIGQLGDPNYLRKIPALFYEFEELGRNAELGYATPGDMRENYAIFYWHEVRPTIDTALQYLRVTHEGRQWIANMHAHVFEIEHANGRQSTTA